MKQSKRITAVSLWIVFFGLLLVVSPTKLPIFVLMLPYIVLFFALRNTWQIAEELIRENKGGDAIPNINERSNLFAAILVGFLALASIGQLTIRDISTVALLATLGYFYLTRNKSDVE